MVHGFIIESLIHTVILLGWFIPSSSSSGGGFLIRMEGLRIEGVAV